MFNHRMLRLSSLLVAISLLLGLAITGCSDKDRDKGEESIVKTFSYVYEKEAAGKVGQDATNLMVIALDEDGNQVTNGVWLNNDPATKDQKIEDQLVDGGTYRAITTVTAKVNRVMYMFYQAKDDEKIYVNGSCIVLTDYISEDAVLTEEDVHLYNISFKCFDVTDEEETAQNEFATGDTIGFKVLDGENDITSWCEVTPVTDPETGVLIQATGAEGLQYGAIGAGTATFVVTFGGVKATSAPVTIKEAEPTDPSKLYICPDGWTLTDDGTVEDKGGNTVDLTTSAPTQMDDFVINETRTVLVVWVDTNGKASAATPEEVRLESDSGCLRQLDDTSFVVTGYSVSAEPDSIKAYTKDAETASENSLTCSVNDD